MLRITLSLLLCVSALIYGQAQDLLYKDQLPALATRAHNDIQAGFAQLQSKFADTMFLQYASYRSNYEWRHNELTSLYKARNFDRLLRQADYWFEITQRDLGDEREMPSTRKANMTGIMEYQRLNDAAVTKAFDTFMEAYTLFQKKVWMRKVHDSTKVVTNLYLTRLEELQQAINRSKDKDRLGNLEGNLTAVRNWDQLASLSVEVRSLVEKIKSTRHYLEDEGFYNLTLEQKLKAGWKPENIVAFGNSVLQAIKEGNQKGFSKLLLSYDDAERIYKAKYPAFDQQVYADLRLKAENSFKDVIAALAKEGLNPGDAELICDYTSLDYMNNITVSQRTTYGPTYDVYIVFPSAKGKYLLTVKEVHNASPKEKVRHLSQLDLVAYR
jgi:hypothetical protein